MKPLILAGAAALALAAPALALAQQLDTTAGVTAASPFKLSGFVTTSFTHSTHADGEDIVGRLYGRRQNEFMLNVIDVTLERVPATDRVDAGFRAETFLGQNAAVVKSVGLDLGTNADIWQAYAVLNLPLGRPGTYAQFKGGKMATLMGVEVGQEVQNPNLEVGSQDVFLEPFTETGAEVDLKFLPRVEVDVRVSNGWDQVTDVNTGKTVMVRLVLTPDDRSFIALLGYTGPEQADDNHDQRRGANLVLSRRITPAASAWLQLDYGQEDAAAADSGRAKWYAAGFWLTYDVAPTATLAFRGDYVNDRNGARTSGVLGFPANDGQKFGSATATLNLKRWEHVLLRPEIRYDRSTLAVFGGHNAQVTFALGLSYLF